MRLLTKAEWQSLTKAMKILKLKYNFQADVQLT